MKNNQTYVVVKAGRRDSVLVPQGNWDRRYYADPEITSDDAIDMARRVMNRWNLVSVKHCFTKQFVEFLAKECLYCTPEQIEIFSTRKSC